MGMPEEVKVPHSQEIWSSKSGRWVVWLKGWIKLIPAWVPANGITALRAVLLAPIYFLYQAGHPLGVFGVFVLAWFTDLIDGPHARFRHQESQLGKILDPAVDKIFVLGLIWMLAPGRLSWAIIVVTLALELGIVLMTFLASPLAARVFKRRLLIGANVWGKIKMFLQGSGLVALTLGLNVRALQLFSEVLFWAAAVFAVVSIIGYIKSMERPV
jgi:CDP-diacylglycerol--glycerol-3-phosphate 3-phosphatidyltransferase